MHREIYIAKSNTTTAVNTTGAWRFLRPEFVEKTAPCSAACPAGEDIGRMELYAGRGEWDRALTTVLWENPFPAVCGRVCFHPCEDACNRKSYDYPIAVHHLERCIGDRGRVEDGEIRPESQSPEKARVAVIGAGPAGLSAAYFLRMLGHACDVFESEPEPGGILRWGIPAYRLPGDVLTREIERIEHLGAVFHCSTPVTEPHVAEIRGRFDAVFMGCGAGRPLKLNIPGETLLTDGLQFLKNIRIGRENELHGAVVVIGGGNTAIDAARTAVRLGGQVSIVYRRRKEDMPAFGPEVEDALDEGVKLVELAAPMGVERQGAELVLTLQQMKPEFTGEGKRATAVPQGTLRYSMPADHIFTAVGTEPDQAWHTPEYAVPGLLRLSHCAIADKKKPVVYGGDLTNDFRSVPDAVASGKQAAMALDTLFRTGWETIESRLGECIIGSGPALSMEIYRGGKRSTSDSHVVSKEEINTDYFQPSKGVKSSDLESKEQRGSFSEVVRTLSPSAAMAEAGRCFNCGACNGCDNCKLFCPEIAVSSDEEKRWIETAYCKGCGICAAECPRNALNLEEESR